MIKERQKTERQKTERPKTERQKTERQKILVVDDEADARNLLADVLSDEGYVVETASDGPTALERLCTFPADLVLTDYWMPGMNGVELIRRVHELNPNEPVLLMTGYAPADLPGEGCALCLQKPMETEDLVWGIDCALACGQQARSLRCR